MLCYVMLHLSVVLGSTLRLFSVVLRSLLSCSDMLRNVVLPSGALCVPMFILSICAVFGCHVLSLCFMLYCRVMLRRMILSLLYYFVLCYVQRGSNRCIFICERYDFMSSLLETVVFCICCRVLLLFGYVQLHYKSLCCIFLSNVDVCHYIMCCNLSRVLHVNREFYTYLVTVAKLEEAKI